MEVQVKMILGTLVVLLCLSVYPSYAATRMKNVYLTFYGFDDNDDGKGHYATGIISDPIIHHRATEDLGTYDHPSTFATDYRILKAGTRIYIPKVRKYFIMEDTCEECTVDANRGRKRIDLYIGGSVQSQGHLLNRCEEELTDDGYHDVVIVDPPSNLPVETHYLYRHGACGRKFTVPN